MKPIKLSLPQLFKGIALFTPGGDLVYCIDPDKQGRWHLHLCSTLQEILGLSEPPHFLVPCYTATVDRWRDPQTHQIKTFAEANPLVMRHQALLNCLFNISGLVWEAATWQENLCDRMMLTTYRASFPQLWEDHDLVVNLDVSNTNTFEYSQTEVSSNKSLDRAHILRLFIAGHSAATERILQILHELLETHLKHPYTLKVIDVLRNPEQAEFNQVSATPTLMKVWPHPIRRIVGNLDNTERILHMLGVSK
ncbi:MAG: circadian clock KaiB family protein [Cyanobacteria bacterium P01_A01_bin.45]